MNETSNPNTNVLPYGRRLQIISLLLKHGPLSLKGIETLLNPPISRRRLHDSLTRLHRMDVVMRRYGQLTTRSGVYYILNGRLKSRKRLAKILRIPLESLHLPPSRRTEMIHSEGCALWCEMLKANLPGSRVLREHQFEADTESGRILKSWQEDLDLLPDILVFLPSQNGTNTFAVEIERSPKTEKRLVRKLWKYAAQTHLDGLIYVCEKQELSERLQHIYHSNIVSKAKRISHYRNNFFLFSDATSCSLNFPPQMVNAALEPVSLFEWATTISKTEIGKRRDAKF